MPFVVVFGYSSYIINEAFVIVTNDSVAIPVVGVVVIDDDDDDDVNAL